MYLEKNCDTMVESDGLALGMIWTSSTVLLSFLSFLLAPRRLHVVTDFDGPNSQSAVDISERLCTLA